MLTPHMRRHTVLLKKKNVNSIKKKKSPSKINNQKQEPISTSQEEVYQWKNESFF